MILNIHPIISFSRVIRKTSGFSFIKHCHYLEKNIDFDSINQKHFLLAKVPRIKIHEKYSFLRLLEKLFLYFVILYYEDFCFFISFLLLHSKPNLAKSLRKSYFDIALYVFLVFMFII